MNDDDREAFQTVDVREHLDRRRFLQLTSGGTMALAAGPLLATSPQQSQPRKPEDSPAARLRRFVDQFDGLPPFSFRYAGTPSETLLARWPRTHRQRALDAGRVEHTITWRDPATRFDVRCVAIVYRDFPTVEWTVFFKNMGPQRSGQLSQLLALATAFQRRADGEFVLHSFDGSTATPSDFQPHMQRLAPGMERLFYCQGGRPTNGALPYFNIDWGGEGVITALGWPGQWTQLLARDNGTGLGVWAGMSSKDPQQDPIADIRFADLANLWLATGEEIRTPLVVIQFWRESLWTDAQNVWRRWMRAYNSPKLPIQPPAPICPTGAVDGYFPGLLDTAADETMFLDRYAAEHTTARAGGTIDHWWMDAGWYQLPPTATDWTAVGTWEPDPKRFPRGLRPVTDHARAQGMKSIVWHEPERVRPGTWLAQQHPEWLHGPLIGSEDRLLDLGIPAARQWATTHFDQLIREQGVDVFRQDFNIDPLPYWNLGDSPGRSGISQIRYVTGYLSFLDELRRRHPAMLIDCCASGGRRLDLETLRRSVPLLRSDYQFEPTGQQCHTYGLSYWLPYYGTGVGPQTRGTGDSYGSSTYVVRSSAAPCFAVGQDVRRASTGDWELIRKLTREWRTFAECLLGDYYALTDYSLETDIWMAWQFERPEHGEGVVQVFRRADNAQAARRFRLRGLQSAAVYELHDMDSQNTVRISGRELMVTGLLVRLVSAPAAAIVTYTRVT